MGSTAEKIEKYKSLLVNLLPLGRLWRPSDQPVLDSTLESLATELCRVEDRTDDLLREADPRNASETLDQWESLLGLPDECTPDNQTDDERRDQIVQKYTNIGGLSAAFYEAIGLQLGFVITVENRVNFIVGRATVGQPLSNYFNESLQVGEKIGGP